MQFKITFSVLQPGQLLPLSYQYELSSWIYKLIGRANSEFGEFLHSQGYVSGNKNFKLFTFSRLWIPRPYEILDDRMKIYAREISFCVSFLVPQAAQELIMGLFREERTKIGDKITQVDLQVKSIEILPPLSLDSIPVRLKTISPLMVGKPVKSDAGKLRHQYLSPVDPEYTTYFFNNLLAKHQTALEHQLAQSITENPALGFRLLSDKPQRSLIRIKAHTPAETKIAGYMFEFELTAPPQLIRVGMLAGFGGENTLGFGATRLL